MVTQGSSEQELLEVETRRLEERGYTVYRGKNDLVPVLLKSFAPDAIAVGREPNYVIEVVREGIQETNKLTELQKRIAQTPGWELIVVLDRGTRAPELRQATFKQIDDALKSAQNVLRSGEAAPGLLLAWGSFEALARRLMPKEFERPQTPGRLIQILTSKGYLSSSDERLLRDLAKARNAVIHGELSESAMPDEVERFLKLLVGLRDVVARESETGETAGDA